ncbi:hypothetical protein, partial [Hyphomicrobium sp.]|uniref:hypothetical protein n=1 Tax=Hyphomicrobium sp. TaxID=82 RepID=UPI002FE36555
MLNTKTGPLVTQTRKTSDWQLTNLGAMVDHVIGLTAYKFAKGELLSKRIAAAIFASPSQWTNMKTGKLPIDVEKLGRLTDYL